MSNPAKRQLLPVLVDNWLIFIIWYCRARVAAIGAGAGLWPEVAKGLPGRTSKSCAERWARMLKLDLLITMELI